MAEIKEMAILSKSHDDMTPARCSACGSVTCVGRRLQYYDVLVSEASTVAVGRCEGLLACHSQGKLPRRRLQHLPSVGVRGARGYWCRAQVPHSVGGTQRVERDMSQGMNGALDVMKPGPTHLGRPALTEPSDVCASVLSIPKVRGTRWALAAPPCFR